MRMAYSHVLYVIWNFDDYPQSHLSLGSLMKIIWPNGNGIGKKKINVGMNTRFGWVNCFQRSFFRHSKYFKNSGKFSAKIINFNDQGYFQGFFSRYLNYSSARSLSPHYTSVRQFEVKSVYFYHSLFVFCCAFTFLKYSKNSMYNKIIHNT